MNLSKPFPLGDYENKNGEVFVLSIQKWVDNGDADYHLYLTTATHRTWNNKIFKTFVLKKYFPTAASADSIAVGDALNEVKKLLDQTKNGETPIYFVDVRNKEWFVQ